MTFSVSIIIPVFNAEKYLRQAVESALQFECVKEVILVEDKSPDDALKLCKVLTEEDHRVKLYQHPNGENRGAGASRNLGIEMATSPYIAFLDADDWYLPNRFDAEKTVFQDLSVDGVYGATGFFYSDTGKVDETRLTSIKSMASSDSLLDHLFFSGLPDEYFHTNAITLKKRILLTAGFFSERLKLHQDSHLWRKIAHIGRLQSGINDTPIALRRVHPDNRIALRNRVSELKYFKALFNFFYSVKVSKKIMRHIFVSVLHKSFERPTKTKKLLLGSYYLLKYPLLLFKI